MMRIMVFDVPAEHGGALTVLNEYYHNACNDKDNEWMFIISKPELSERENIKIIKLPWVKKSWFHRLYFDKFYSARFVKKYNPDRILSLQNTVVNGRGVFQELYVHQPLPFCEKKFTFKENRIYWIYQNIISKIIFSSVRKADHVIVQTNWMRDSVCEKANVSKEKVTVEQPEVIIPEGIIYNKTEQNLFFYPASSAAYKNHHVIYKAANLLVKNGYENFKIILTIKKPLNFSDEFKCIEDKIQFCGRINREQVFKYYSESVLIFPSYIETFGLPLKEARKINTPILASDCAFSRDVLDGYEKVHYFNPFDYTELYNDMKNFIKYMAFSIWEVLLIILIILMQVKI